jgi:2-keto-4-pentenoate hydratase
MGNLFASQVFPAIEVVASRFENESPACLAIGDNGSHGRLLLGEHLQLDGKLWAQTFTSQASFQAKPVTISINGRELARGSGFDVMGSPLLALTWLANALHQQGHALRQNDVVITGTMTGITPATAGDHVQAHFSGFGALEIVMK